MRHIENWQRHASEDAANSSKQQQLPDKKNQEQARY
jgi:hypothetical protein